MTVLFVFDAQRSLTQMHSRDIHTVTTEDMIVVVVVVVDTVDTGEDMRTEGKSRSR